jgi:FMN hydrolase / 5-amino-6-(5-phospho-D-ribitylamino)uracil phosphatase
VRGRGRQEISTVVFDADETLVDLRPAVRRALLVVLAEMRRLAPAARELTLADLEADATAAFDRLHDEPVEVARRQALAWSLARVGLADEIDRLAEIFFANRFAATRLYDGVPRLLARLRRSYVVGLGSNGNNHAGRVGLAGQFAFEVYAHVDGVPKKPAAAFFEAVLAAAGAAAPESVVHVGNHWDHDVAGAAALALRTVWLNRAGEPCPEGANGLPDAEIRSLAELPAVLSRL